MERGRWRRIRIRSYLLPAQPPLHVRRWEPGRRHLEMCLRLRTRHKQ